MSYVLFALLFATRPVDPIALETLNHALARSPIVRSLVETLEASNVIVHIQSSRHLPAGISGTTRFVASRGGHRYLRITIACELSKTARAAILGHELQHAVEIATSATDDITGVRRLFEERGDGSGGYFETRAAIAIERRVRRELAGLQAEPVAKFHH